MNPIPPSGYQHSSTHADPSAFKKRMEEYAKRPVPKHKPVNVVTLQRNFVEWASQYVSMK